MVKFNRWVLSRIINYSACHKTHLCVISGFRRGINEIRVLLGFYTALNGISLPTFRDNLSVSSSSVKQSKWHRNACNQYVHYRFPLSVRRSMEKQNIFPDQLLCYSCNQEDSINGAQRRTIRRSRREILRMGRRP